MWKRKFARDKDGKQLGGKNLYHPRKAFRPQKNLSRKRNGRFGKEANKGGKGTLSNKRLTGEG